MRKVCIGLSGSGDNETNIKLIWYYNNILGRPEKKKIISCWRGYHGSGPMTGALTGLELFQKKIDLPFGQVLHTEVPYFFVAPIWVRVKRSLGSMFGLDHYGIKPDLVTIAKGLTSAYAPLLGSIISEKMWRVLEQGTDENGPIGHGWAQSR